jgi:hypothetical protein
MGMLFNTANTAKILQMLDNYFGPGQLTNLNANDFLHWPLATGTYNYLAGKGLYFPNDQTLDQKWMTWLQKFDKHLNQKKGNHENTATTVGNAISYAISNHLKQIEFFAVPDDIPNSTHISAEAGQVTDPAGDVSEWITLYTLTHDKVSNTVQRSPGKKPKPKK